MYFARDHSLGLNLHAPFSKDHSVIAARNDNAVPLNLSFNLGVFPENERLLRNDVPLNRSVHAERPRNLQGALESHSLVNKSSPLFAHSVY